MPRNGVLWEKTAQASSLQISVPVVSVFVCWSVFCCPFFFFFFFFFCVFSFGVVVFAFVGLCVVCFVSVVLCCAFFVCVFLRL